MGKDYMGLRAFILKNRCRIQAVRVQDSGLWILKCGIEGLGFRVQGSGFRI